MAEMNSAPPAAADYFFHLDALPERVNFSRSIEIAGWLFHRQGAAIHGLRAAVRSPLPVVLMMSVGH